MKLSVAVCAGFLLAVSVLLAGVLVCRECGYENADGNEVCTHCKAKLPVKPVKPAEGPADEKSTPSKAKPIDSKFVDNEVKMAEQHFTAGDFEIANLFARNAAALEMLVDPAVKSDRSERIVELRKRSETGGMTVDRKCPACGGSGKYIMETAALDNKTTTIEVAGKSCPKCGGSGKVMKPSTMDERRFKLGRGQSRYTALQQSRKFLPLGAAWIPAELDGTLSVKQTVQVKRAVALPCPDCIGLGRMDCAKCKGVGEIKCTYTGCLNGKVEVTDEGRLVKGKLKKTVKCKSCNGMGLIACAECRAKGSILCKRCNGSGERALCSKCGGQGAAACKKCQGTGKVKDVTCGECRGDGVQECTGCNGDGRKK